MMDYKFTENPFSSRKPPTPNVAQRSPWLGPVAYTLLACGLLMMAFSSSLPNNSVVLTPSQSDRPPFRPAGLRGQDSLRLVVQGKDEESSSPPNKGSLTVANDSREDDVDDSDHDPQYIMPLRKFLGTRQQAAQREHHEIHDQVQDHIFGQNRSGVTVEIEEDPSVIIKDWESDADVVEKEEKVDSSSKESSKAKEEEVVLAPLKEEPESSSHRKEEQSVAEKQ
ncbi:hypothetical protein FisN_27Lh023 [Fistulifera solaris]|uniref:Uncharacterized protein n=1 Tax=Fistulifera solaris TaxID=1519565 RepID=A0A1Z5JHR0_FISSO|nr:hypothetical protein FisN_27Lh023 [Fistulifera solaris]|eukprot:GAX13534.1 hypothetical protein FisN_27Lh023 [Fistulifera solaris]